MLIAFAGLVALLIAGGIWQFNYSLAFSSGQLHAQAVGFAAQYPSDTDKRIETCFSDAETSPIGCVKEALAFSRDAQRSELDLAAQQNMADGAFWALIIASLSMLITSIGTVFLARQVQLTSKAVKDTENATGAMMRQNEIAESAQRPWVVITPSIKSFRTDTHGVRIQAECAFKNQGQTAAFDVSLFAKIVPMDADAFRHIRSWYDEHLNNDSVNAHTIIPNEESLYFNDASFSTEHLPWHSDREAVHLIFIAICRYRPTPISEWCVTARSYAISHIEREVFADRYLFREDITRMKTETTKIVRFGPSLST